MVIKNKKVISSPSKKLKSPTKKVVKKKKSNSGLLPKPYLSPKIKRKIKKHKDVN